MPPAQRTAVLYRIGIELFATKAFGIVRRLTTFPIASVDRRDRRSRSGRNRRELVFLRQIKLAVSAVYRLAFPMRAC